MKKIISFTLMFICLFAFTMSVHCQDVSATGLEIAITQDITVNAGKVEYGGRYTIEKKVSGKNSL